jgi:hypothetical protein
LLIDQLDVKHHFADVERQSLGLDQPSGRVYIDNSSSGSALLHLEFFLQL